MYITSVGCSLHGATSTRRAISQRWSRLIPLFLARTSRYGFVVCITEHEESAAVLARFNFLPVQSKYGRTEPIALGTRCARYYRPARTLRGDCASPVRPPAATPKLTRRLATRLLRGWIGRPGIEPLPAERNVIRCALRAWRRVGETSALP